MIPTTVVMRFEDGDKGYVVTFERHGERRRPSWTAHTVADDGRNSTTDDIRFPSIANAISTVKLLSAKK